MEGESPKSASTPTGAVFLSYASEDAAAAERIAVALRSGGIEVWFDKSELRGGDAWDRRIREQIHECRLFIAVISAHTEARDEGYFRREWKLAVDRTHDMAEDKPFIVPVALDPTSERSARVPDSFKHVQWSRLPEGATTPAFVERVQRLLSPEAPTTVRASLPAIERPPILSRPKRVLPSAIAAAVVVALLFASGYFGLERLRASRPTIQGESIAVLPLTNESGDASQQYFSDGLSEDLITALSQLPGLKVIGRHSSFQFRDSRDDSKTIGAKLGVGHLLEGSVRHAGDVVRVSTELVDTSDGSTQWSERYDRPYKNLFALQDDITRAVAVALRVRLVQGERSATQSDRPPSGNLEAYNAVLEGRYYLARDGDSGSDNRKAIERFTHATQLDPRYAFAWSLLSRAWTNLAAYHVNLAAAPEAYERARSAGNAALSFAPDLPSVHIARGWLLENADFDWHGAEAEYRRALELAPESGDAAAGLARQLSFSAQLEAAIKLTQQALATDPLQSRWHSWLAVDWWGLNRFDEAERAIRRAIELQPGGVLLHSMLTDIEIGRGNPEGALAAAQQEPPGSFFRETALAKALQIGKDRTAAESALRKLLDKPASWDPYHVAQVYAMRNDADETFKWLDAAWTYRDPSVHYLLYDPFLRRYKDDPRFAAFCRKVGLPTPAEVAGRT